MYKKTIIRALAFGALFSAAPAFAQNAVDIPITVALEVQDGCVINGNNPTNQSAALLSFGSIQNAGGVTRDINGSTSAGVGTPITVSCNVNSTTAAFSIDGGTNATGGVRNLSNPSAPIGSPARLVRYRIYSDAAHTSEYQINTPQPVNGGTITAGTPFTVPLEGLIAFADVNAAIAGDYTDDVTGTLSF